MRYLLPIGLVLISCASEEKKIAPEAPIVAERYDLEQGEVQRFKSPLPNMIPYYVNWHYTDETSKRVLAYRGWDFDDDGQIEMLEVLNLEGESVAFAYDFNRDGTIDMVRKKQEFSLDIDQAKNMPKAPSSVKKSQLAH